MATERTAEGDWSLDLALIYLRFKTMADRSWFPGGDALGDDFPILATALITLSIARGWDFRCSLKPLGMLCEIAEDSDKWLREAVLLASDMHQNDHESDEWLTREIERVSLHLLFASGSPTAMREEFVWARGDSYQRLDSEFRAQFRPPAEVSE